MKDTGIIRRIDDLGRIVIPIEIRKRFGIEKRDPLEIYIKGDRIILGKPQTVCVFCGKKTDLVEHHGHQVCGSCRRELAAAS